MHKALEQEHNSSKSQIRCNKDHFSPLSSNKFLISIWALTKVTFTIHTSINKILQIYLLSVSTSSSLMIAAVFPWPLYFPSTWSWHPQFTKQKFKCCISSFPMFALSFISFSYWIWFLLKSNWNLTYSKCNSNNFIMTLLKFH